jgi:hypothetical protein
LKRRLGPQGFAGRLHLFGCVIDFGRDVGEIPQVKPRRCFNTFAKTGFWLEAGFFVDARAIEMLFGNGDEIRVGRHNANRAIPLVIG